MSKKAYVYTIFGVVVFVILSGLLIYFCSDVAPYDDRHLEIKKRSAPKKENGFFEIAEALSLIVRHENITKKQSSYIAKLNLDDRLIKFEEAQANERLDKVYVEALLAPNQKSFEKLKSALSYKEFYIDPPIEINDIGKTDVMNLLYLSKLLLIKANLCLIKKDQEGYCRYVEKALRLADAVDQATFVQIDAMVVLVIKSMAIASLKSSVLQGHIDPEIVFSILGAIKKFQLKSFEDVLQGDYLFFKNTTAKAIVEANGLGRIKVSLFYKRNMTLHLFGEYLTQCLKCQHKPYSKKIYLLKSLVQDVSSRNYLNKNFYGDVLVALNVGTLPKFIESFYQFETKISLLDTLIALRRFENKYKKLPKKLIGLVPEFLEKVPVDAFDRKPIKYLQAQRKIWSVGVDIVLDPSQPKYSVMKKEDAVIVLPPSVISK